MADLWAEVLHRKHALDVGNDVMPINAKKFATCTPVL
jgi:hypothetical protein